MATSSPSQTKARSKDGKSNGSGRAAAAKLDTTPQSPAASARPSDEEIARRAYEIYEREGRQPGSELQNWLAAEAELSGSKNH